MDGATSQEEGKLGADASEEDEPEPMLGLNSLAVALPPENLDEPAEDLAESALLDHRAASLDALGADLPSDPVSRDVSAHESAIRADADAALKAAAELAKPAAEAAKAAAEETLAAEAGRGNASTEAMPPALESPKEERVPTPPPPDKPPEMLGSYEDIPAQALRTVSQNSSPPLPPPPWHPDQKEEAQRPLEPGHRVVLTGLVDHPSFNGLEGEVQRFNKTEQVYEVRAYDGRQSILVKVGAHHVSRQDGVEQEPPLSLALPVQDDEAFLSPVGNRASAATRTSRSSRHSNKTRNSELDTLQSLHFAEDSLAAKLLLAYCRQVAKRPVKLICLYTVAVMVPLIVLIIFRGFELETDFSAFIKADGAAARDRDAYLLALSDKKDLSGRRLSEVYAEETWSEDDEEEVFDGVPYEPRRLEEDISGNVTSSTGRRMKSLFLRKEFEVLFRAKSGSILTEKAMQEVQRIETSMREGPSFKHLCENRITTEAKKFLCDPGQSLTAFAFPTQAASTAGSVLFEVTWDGVGRDMLPTSAVLAYMKMAFSRGDQSRSNRRYFPKDFSYPDIGERLQAADLPLETRTKYSFHLDVGVSGDSSDQVSANIELVKAEWQDLINNELLPYFRSVEGEQVDFFYASTEIDGIEINGTLMSDLFLAIGSILFVIFYLRVHTGTWLVSISSFFIIFISVPLAYVATPAAKATIASFLSVFLITGIGCDVVFVFTDFWEQSKGQPNESRLMWTIVHAGESCLATSITTALSFFANLASALQPLREFGMFMGLCVMSAYLLVLLILPPLLVVAEKRKQKAVKTRTVDISSGEKASLAVVQPDSKGAPKKKDSVMQGLLFTLAGGIAGCPRMVMLFTFIFFITAAIGVVTSAKLSTGVPDIFPEWHNQVASKEVLANFATEAFLTTIPAAKNNVCVAHTMNGTSSAGCVLHWCEALQEWMPGTTTTTTTGEEAAQEVYCLRSPTMTAADRHSLGYGFEACSQVTVYSRVAGASPVDRSVWSRTLLQAVGDEVRPDSVTPSSVMASQINPLVVEDWETGEVDVLNFQHSGNVVAFPRPLQALNGSEVACEMHAMCFEAGRFQCGIQAWKDLGSGLYELGSTTRRLDHGSRWDGARARRLQTGPLVPQAVSSALDVVVLWGIRSTRSTPLVGPPSEFWSFDPNFEPRNPWAQRAIRAMCSDLPERLKIFRAKCWIHLFADFLSGQRKRFPTRNFDDDVVDWYYSNTIEAQAGLWFEDRKVIACMVQFWVNVRVTVPSVEGLSYMQLWDEYVQEKNAQASVTANSAWHSASVWVRSEAEKAIVGSTVSTIIIAACSGWAGVLLFTGDVMLAMVVTGIVLVVITGLAFFMVTLMGWSIGPIEVISLVIFVGYSVTYALHIAHNYNQMVASDDDLLEAEEKARKRQLKRDLAKARRRSRLKEEGEGGDPEDMDDVQLAMADADKEVFPEDLDAQQLRKARTRVAVLHVGGATLSSALSTAGSSAFLLFCTLTIFVKLGTVVVAVTVLSILGAIVALPAALILVGPAPDAWYKRQLRMCMAALQGKKAEQEKPLLTVTQPEEDRFFVEGEIHKIS